MKPFHVITTPHSDILEGKLTMDIFAADLWEVYKKRAPSEYRDSDIFFSRTYMTIGLNNLLEVVRKRTSGKGGDAIMQLETPFGGGKTHSLIAIYHKSVEWSTKTIVIVGTALDPSEQTLWGVIEEQLTGKVTDFTGNISPGKEKLRKLLEVHQPLIILLDEVLEFVTKASGIKVEQTNLGAQTLAFMQEISELVSTLERTCLLITLPSSDIEHYDEGAERLFQQLKKVSGRVEKVYTPVQDEEISRIIRKRLFTDVDDSQVKSNVLDIFEYLRKENILPQEIEPSVYKNKFIDSYPFLPDVLDCLYHRWGSYPTFQRTRGLLRLLSIIIHSLSESKNSYISLADFNLSIEDLRRELLKFTGNEYDSVVAMDITEKTSNAKKVDKGLPSTYRGLKIGTRIANTMFLYSFSGGHERGATIQDIKRSATLYDIPSAIIGETISKMENSLFYIHKTTDKYLFTTEPNLNRMLLIKIDNISDIDVLEKEEEFLRKIVRTGTLICYIWPKEPSDIQDNRSHKLIILRDKDDNFMNSLLENKGKVPRVYRNIIYFLTSSESKRIELHHTIKRAIAWDDISKDNSLKLNEGQKQLVKNSAKKAKEKIISSLRDSYKYLYIPNKDGFEEKDLGVATFGEEINLEKEVFSLLKDEGYIIDKIIPEAFVHKYLQDKDHVSTKQIYESSLKTRGETRLIDRDKFETCIEDGIKRGVFGLGILSPEDEVVLSHWEEDVDITLSEEEILVTKNLSLELVKLKESKDFPDEIQTELEEEKKEPTEQITLDGVPTSQIMTFAELPEISLKKGRASDLSSMISYLQTKFKIIKVKIKAEEGAISKSDYEDKIEEAIDQLE